MLAKDLYSVKALVKAKDLHSVKVLVKVMELDLHSVKVLVKDLALAKDYWMEWEKVLKLEKLLE